MTVKEYRRWILMQPAAGFVFEEAGTDRIRMIAPYARGDVVFHEQDIIELIITLAENEEICFYLHFQLKEEDHAKALFLEMQDTFLKMKDGRKTRVLLTCTSGLTTSYFAQELNRAAGTLQLDYDFSAVNFSYLYDKGFTYDVILLAPQVHYEYQKVKEIFRDKLVLKIPAAVFARYSTGSMLEIIIGERKKLERRQNSDLHVDLRTSYENDYRILTLALINNDNMYRFGYRIYDHGIPTLDKEVIKQTFREQDLFDLMDYVTARHRNIDAISLAISGVTYHGQIYEPQLGFMNRQLGRQLTEKYGIPVILINDVNAIALGYYAYDPECSNMVFYYQPRGSAFAGAGVLIGGHLVRGWKHAAGEVGSLTKAFVENADEKMLTPEGAVEVVGTGLLAYIATIAPEKIAVFSEMTPDMSELRSYLSRYVAEDFIPELVSVGSLKNLMLPGAMIHALDVFDTRTEWVNTHLKKRSGNDIDPVTAEPDSETGE